MEFEKEKRRTIGAAAVMMAPQPLGANGTAAEVSLGGFGFHDITILSSVHSVHLLDLSPAEIAVFKNHGSSAKASMSHSHCQILALPVIRCVHSLIAIQKLKVFLDLGDKDMRQINALFCEVIKRKIKACKLKEEGEALKIYTESAKAKIHAVLETLGTMIEKKKVGCIRIDGGIPTGSRHSLVRDFQEKDGVKAAVALFFF
ncbi:hypothetical protein L1887_07996 [Cichorium endivia]|nr:hypothetical protein L1887_07996 [Cichorium endivia]